MAVNNVFITTAFSDIDHRPVILSIISEDFESNGVVVTLKWLTHVQLIYTYHVDIVPQPSSLIIGVNRSSVQLKILYNLAYNVSVVKMSPCGQSIATIIELYYGECHT